ncbi:Choline-sulfatase [Stieleria maiorica]|uniref:Choline-sulfatase n=2 Tax=Stieleria maiorica TaxID=2795974 RepID=A0A5B9MM03_9BACT|nr:Choline-sulfatase [Stieleria maiorica]
MPLFFAASQILVMTELKSANNGNGMMMDRMNLIELRDRLTTLFGIVILGLSGAASAAEDADAPDVLFIVVDDMNDWISLLDPDAPIKTPNLERLARRGMLFTRAYCASPACNPSRAATLTGLRPSTTGVYGNKSDWRGAVPDRRTIMQQFMVAGYDVRGAGKIFHHHLGGAFHDDESFRNFQPMRPQKYPPNKLNGAPEYGSPNTDWGQWPSREEDSIDFHTASYCVGVLSRPASGQPLFLACGIYKPHSPFFAPADYHNAYGDIALPARKEDDWRDLPAGAASLLRSTKWFWQGMMNVEKKQEGSYQNFIQAYAACTAFADAQIGRVLDALDKSPRRDSTIVVLWSDHGFHLGEKDHIEKFALWEKSNHIPFIVVAPSVAKPGSRCRRPVDMTSLYPTLLELCGLPADANCDGDSLVPLLRDPNAKWISPAMMTYMRGNHAVRSDRWRYIRYADGSEELYDHDADPNEWHNLAGQKRYAEVIASHSKWLPTTEAKQVPDLKRRQPRPEIKR